jgi:soluble lytic murein transglycosylase
MLRVQITLVFLLYLHATLVLPAFASVELQQQRQDYLDAKRALKKRDPDNFHALYTRLDDYILQGYLQYEFLKQRISSTPIGAIRQFLDENKHAPISTQLRDIWLEHLAAAGDEETFLKEYRGTVSNPKLRCYRLKLLFASTADAESLSHEVERLWLTRKRLPAICDKVFRHWQEAGYLTRDLVWARIKLLMARNRLSHARQVANQYLNANDKVWLRRWQTLYRDPARRLLKIDYPVETELARMIVTNGVIRLANRDPDQAMMTWQRLRQKHSALTEDEDRILREVGIIATRQHLPSAEKWLSRVTESGDDKDLRHWRLRAMLRAGDWQKAKQVIENLTEDEQVDRFWLYWTARVMAQTGENAKARYLFALVATERNYYGFLSADHIGVGYTMQHRSINASPDEVMQLLKRPGIRAARELYAIGDFVTARRQWNWNLSRMDKRELKVAALIAREWGWHDRVVYTLSKSGHRHDIDLRFPLLYRPMVETNAKANSLDPSWIFSVMRQESAFVADARSSAGALGLMQLMPRVGRATGRQLKLRIRSNDAILNVENNLRLGAAFLKNMLRRYKGHQMLATAAYNAGPTRVRGWLPQSAAIDADVWVETIPFEETRDYVKNVMAYTAVYDHRLGRRPVRLCQRMPSVAARASAPEAESACPFSKSILDPAG